MSFLGFIILFVFNGFLETTAEPMPTTTPKTIKTTSTTTKPSTEPTTVQRDLVLRIRRDSEDEDYKYIKPESLDPKNFVICDGECKDEGFWALIGELNNSFKPFLTIFSFWSWWRPCFDFLHNWLMRFTARTNYTWNYQHNNLARTHWWIPLCWHRRYSRLGICWRMCRWCWCYHNYHQRWYMHEK